MLKYREQFPWKTQIHYRSKEFDYSEVVQEFMEVVVQRCSVKKVS